MAWLEPHGAAPGLPRMFNVALRNRLAVKHAHSPMEPERDWGTDPLNSIRYVLYALNQEHAATGEREFELPSF